MDYPPTTEQFREHVRRQMMDEAKRQLDRVNGAAGTEGGGNPHRPTALREGGGRAPIWNSRKEPDPEARPVQGGKSVNSRTSEGRPDFDYVVHTNHAASAMPTRKRTSRTRFRVITGGRR